MAVVIPALHAALSRSLVILFLQLENARELPGIASDLKAGISNRGTPWNPGD